MKLKVNFPKEGFQEIIEKNYKIALYLTIIKENRILESTPIEEFVRFIKMLWYNSSEDNNQDILGKLKFDLDIDKFRKWLEEKNIELEENTEKIKDSKVNLVFKRKRINWNEFLEVYYDNWDKNESLIMKIFSPEKLYLSYIPKYSYKNNKIFCDNEEVLEIVNEKLFEKIIKAFPKIKIKVDLDKDYVEINRNNYEEILKILANKILKNEILWEIYEATPYKKK